MTIEELVGTTLTHNVFGDVVITGVDIDYTDLSKAKLIANVHNKNIKFKVDTIYDYFSNIPEEVQNDIDEVVNLSKQKHKPIEYVEKPKPVLDAYNYDEHNNELTIENWKNVITSVTTFWWADGMMPIPLVMDEKILYISAKAACVALGIRLEDYSNIYDVCNGNVSPKQIYKGHKWRFATTHDIHTVINKLENEND